VEGSKRSNKKQQGIFVVKGFEGDMDVGRIGE